MKLSSGAMLITIALLSGCQTTPEAPTSGFLGDYSQLKPATDREGVMLYIDQNADLRPYTKLMLDPVQVLVTPDPNEPPPPSDALAKFAGIYQQSLERALVPTYQVVNAPGPDVLRVRSAITGIKPAKPATGATDFLPIKAVYNVGVEAAGVAPRVVEMKSEIEVLDPNGKRVAAATTTRKGDQRLPQGQQITWEQVQAITDYWAKNFRTRLDQLRGVQPPPVAQDGAQ